MSRWLGAGKGWAVALLAAGMMLASGSAQAVFFVNHRFSNFTQSSTITNMIMYDSGPFFESLTPLYSAGPSNTIISTGPYIDDVTRVSFVGLIGDEVVVGMDATAAGSAVGQEFFSVFGTLESSIRDAIIAISSGFGAVTGFDTLFEFFSDNAAKLYAIGSPDEGKLMQFSSGVAIGGYTADVSDAPASVPEPFTMALGAAAAGLGAVRQRRRRRVN